jgi:glycosyltransferase involved in cell wall biosynthesis
MPCRGTIGNHIFLGLHRRRDVPDQPGVVDVCRTASDVLSPSRPLVVVGGEDGRSTALDATARRAVRRGLIRFVPKVSDAELAWLYRNADLFINLSLGEGFGLPPVEALSFGCPAIVSDSAVYRENLGDQATYVDPLDVGAVATAIRSTTFGPIDPVPRFGTWEDCVVRAREAIVATVQFG